MLASVEARGCVPVCTAYCSAGRPKASKPRVCRTLCPVIRWKRAKTSVAMYPSGCPTCRPGARGVREHVHDELLGLGGHRRIAAQVAVPGVRAPRRCPLSPRSPASVPRCRRPSPPCSDAGPRVSAAVESSRSSSSKLHRSSLPGTSETKNPLAQEGTPRRFRPRRSSRRSGTDQRGPLSRRRTARMRSGYRKGRERPHAPRTAPASCAEGGEAAHQTTIHEPECASQDPTAAPPEAGSEALRHDESDPLRAFRGHRSPSISWS